MGTRCCLLLVVFFLFLSLRCSFEEPKAPVWEVDVNCPVSELNLTMHDLIQDYENVIDYGDGYVGLRTEGALDTTHVGEHLHMPDMVNTLNVDIPNITISRLLADEVTFALPTLMPDSGYEHGQRVAISAFEFSSVVGDITPEQDVDTITLTHGTARLTYTNNLPVDLKNVTFQLYDSLGTNIKLATQPIDIDSGTSDSLDLDISGKKLNRFDKWRISGSSPGSSQPVAIDTSSSCLLNMHFVDFRVSTVRGKGQAFYIEHRDSVILDEALWVDEAEFKEGELSFVIANDLPMDLDIEIVSDKIINVFDGKPLTINTRVASRHDRAESVDLRSYKLRLGEDGMASQAIAFIVEAEGQSGNDEYVTMSEMDSIHVDFSIKNALVKYFRGRLNHFAVPLEAMDQRVHLPSDLERFAGLYLSDARLIIDFYNSLEMPITLDGELIGVGKDQREARVQLNAEIAAGSGNDAQMTQHIVQTPANQDLLRVINLPPERLKFQGQAYIGDGSAIGVINPADYIIAQYVLETPAHMSWNESILNADTTNMQIFPMDYPSQNTSDDIVALEANETNHLRSFALVTDIDNHLPISASIEFSIVGDSIAAEDAIVLRSIHIGAAKTDEQGRAIESKKVNEEVPLPQEHIDIFHNHGTHPKQLQLISTVTLHGTEDTKVKVFNTDYISFKAAAKAKVSINDQD